MHPLQDLIHCNELKLFVMFMRGTRRSADTYFEYNAVSVFSGKELKFAFGAGNMDYLLLSGIKWLL